jgi:hypothetical protein
MSWYKVKMSADDVISGKHMELQNAFSEQFFAMHAPKDAAMFATSTTEDEYLCFFSPGCSAFFSTVLSSHGAVKCSAPVRGSVALVVGHQDAIDRLLS